MGLLDTATDYANKASSALDSVTGGQKTGTSKAAEVKFEKDERLSGEDKNEGIVAGPDTPGSEFKPNVKKTGIPTEFIHFGQVHPDSGDKFPHETLTPETMKPPLEGHGIMFRDALVREAILLFGFVSSTKVAVQDTTKQRGAVEEIGAMASNLLGGSNTTSKPDPLQLDTFLGKIKSETGKINKVAIEYKDTHECGKQFHTIRADYAAFCKSLDDYYLQPPKSEGIGAIGDAIGSAAANIPGVGKILGIVQRIAFKFLDLYLAAFLELRKNHERSIELAVHALTIEAIKNKYVDYVPVYPVWFKKPEPKETDEETKTDEGGEKDKNAISTDEYTKPVTDKVTETVDDVKKKVDDIRNDIYDFAGANGAPEPTPASGYLSQAFSALKGSEETVPGAVPSAADCIIKGLEATLKDIVSELPKFMKTVIREIMEGNIALLEDVYARVMAQGATGGINSAMLLQGGRRYLTTRISSALTKLIFGMITGGDDFKIGVPGGDKDLSAQQLLGKQLDERLGKYIEPVLQICIGDLAGQLDASLKKAQGAKAETMEVLLGRLPWLTAMMFRNTFFPIWNLVAEEIMGKISPPLKSALKAINEPFNKAKDVIDTGQEYKRRAEEAKKQAEEAKKQAEKLKDKASSVNVGTSTGDKDLKAIEEEYKKTKEEAGDIQEATETETEEGKRRREEREAAEREKENLDKFYQDNDKDKEFPVSSREAKCKGVKVPEEIPSVLKAAA